MLQTKHNLFILALLPVLTAETCSARKGPAAPLAETPAVSKGSGSDAAQTGVNVQEAKPVRQEVIQDPGPVVPNKAVLPKQTEEEVKEQSKVEKNTGTTESNSDTIEEETDLSENYHDNDGKKQKKKGLWGKFRSWRKKKKGQENNQSKKPDSDSED